MTCIYTAAFDVVAANALYGFGTLTLATAGETNVVLTLGGVTAAADNGDAGATTFWVSDDDKHCVDQSPLAQTRFAHFAQLAWSSSVEAALRTAATAAGWAAKIPSVSWSSTTGAYTFTVATVTSSLTWSTTAGRTLFGFAADSTTASSHTSAITPTFVVKPTLSVGVSEPTPNYEPRGIGNRISSDTGAGFGTARYVSPLYRDWIQQYETKAKTIRLSVDESHPWSFQHLFEHCRGMYPFIVIDGGFGSVLSYPEVFTFREDGIPWVPERATPGNDAQFHIPFHCVVEGYLQSAAA